MSKFDTFEGPFPVNSLFHYRQKLRLSCYWLASEPFGAEACDLADAYMLFYLLNCSEKG